MKYMKPSVVALADALKAIQSGVKGAILMESLGPDQRPTNGAYEADE